MTLEHHLASCGRASWPVALDPLSLLVVEAYAVHWASVSIAIVQFVKSGTSSVFFGAVRDRLGDDTATRMNAEAAREASSAASPASRAEIGSEMTSRS